MAITSLVGFNTAARVYTRRRVTQVRAPTIPYTIFDLTTTLPWVVGLAANGGPTVPTQATAGYFALPPLDTGKKHYLSRVTAYGSPSLGRWVLYDRLFRSGAWTSSSNLLNTVVSPPSYSARVPGGTDYNNLELWVEDGDVALGGGSMSLDIKYTNESGTTGRSAPVTSVDLFALGRMVRMRLQDGDTGIQKLESVQASGTRTFGTYNMMVMRRLAAGRFGSDAQADSYARGMRNHDWMSTQLVEVFNDSAFFPVLYGGGGNPTDFELEIVSG